MPGEVAALDGEFLFLLSLLRPAFACLDPGLRDQARLWLQRLCHVPARSDAARKDRNEYLCRLYDGMLQSKLHAVFLAEPPEGALRPARDVFPEEDATTWLRDAASGADAAPSGPEDADERTYLATEVFPGGLGAYSYLAVSLAKGEPHWVSGWQPDEPQAASTPLVPGDSLPAAALGRSGMETRSPRPTSEQRQNLISFYDSLIRDLDRAMEEPEKTSPELEKLITSFQDESSVSDAKVDVSSRQKDLVQQLRERLGERRERAVERSLLLESLDLEESLPALQRPAARRDEDDVWNIRPENVALLEAAYPARLVARFLDAIVRERVAVLGRVRARRYCRQHVDGLEEDAAADMEHYQDAIGAWAKELRTSSIGEATAETAQTAAAHADRCADSAAKAMGLIKDLGAARLSYFNKMRMLCDEQDRLKAEIEMLRSEDAALRRRLQSPDGGGAT